jgi:LacI family sucrose operon transcriptional repressor
MQQHPGLDGIFASSDMIAAETIQACRLLRKSIPEEIKIVGYDDVRMASLMSPRLTTVRQPIREMCERTIEMVVKRLEGAEVPMVTTFPVALIERETT